MSLLPRSIGGGNEGGNEGMAVTGVGKIIVNCGGGNCAGGSGSGEAGNGTGGGNGDGGGNGNGNGTGGGTGTMNHNELLNRGWADQHPMGAITGLTGTLDGKVDAGRINDLYRGPFPSVLALETAWPDDEPGAYATVISSGESSMFLWNDLDGEWQDSGISGIWVEQINGKIGPVVVLTPSDIGAETKLEKGQANGYAALGPDAKVPAGQLPEVVVNTMAGSETDRAPSVAAVKAGMNAVSGDIAAVRADLDGKADKAPGMGLSEANFTQAEKDKLARLGESRFKGRFTSLGDLEETTGKPGDYAHVDEGPDGGVKTYVWDEETGEWVERKTGLVWDEDAGEWVERESGGGVPAGCILMWSGALDAIPESWALCDGTNGTPNLLDKFILGVPDASTDPGATGGAHLKTLTADNMPSHAHAGPWHSHAGPWHAHWIGSHTHSLSGAATGAGGSHSHTLQGRRSTTGGDTYNHTNGGSGTPTVTLSSATGTNSAGSHSHSISGSIGAASGATSAAGSGTAFDARPAWYALAYIMKL